jgi:hypothetical protein
VRLPVEYDKTVKSYLILFRLEGSANFFLHTVSTVDYLSHMRDLKAEPVVVAVVAVENPDRDPDLDTERVAEKFVGSLKTDLIPYIGKNYRTNVALLEQRYFGRRMPMPHWSHQQCPLHEDAIGIDKPGYFVQAEHRR